MHRTRTRFAARVNRVATGLERRGVVATYESHDRLLANRASRRRYAHESHGARRVPAARSLERLRKDGYATLPLSELVPDPERLEGARGGRRALRHRDARPGSLASKRAASRRCAVGPARSFSSGSTRGASSSASTIRGLRLGTNPRLLDLANAYLGMWSKLEYVDVWYTPPAGSDERLSSQRWHRDFNDRHLLKAFLYLVDVDERGRAVRIRAAQRARRRARGAVAVAPARRQLSAGGRVRASRSTAGRSRSPRRRGRSSSATPPASTAAALRPQSRARSRRSRGIRRRH